MSEGRTILVVDDNPVTRLLCERILARSGYAVRLAENGAVAVALCESSHEELDAIIMDIMMPVMNGPKAIAGIRKDEEARALNPLPIIVLTSQDTPEDRADCEAAGCDDYLCRPVSSVTLSETIERHLPIG